MQTWALLLLILLVLPQAEAGARRSLNRQETKFLERLNRRCKDGEGQACDSYAQLLQGNNPKLYAREIKKFTRRACTLAYLPACKRQDGGQAAKTKTPYKQAVVAAKETEGPTCGKALLSDTTFSPITLPSGVRAQQITRVNKGSMLERAGFQVGDVITKVNGTEIQVSSQFSDALDAGGGAMLEVKRESMTFPAALTCP